MVARANLSRRSLLAATGGAALALTPLACGGGNGGSGFAQASGDKVPDQYAKRTHVVVWHAYADIPGNALAALAKKFNESQQDVYVEVQFQGSYDETAQKVTAAVQAKKIPDLVTFSEVNWHNFYLNDLLEPLDGYFGSGLKKSDYNQKLLNEGVLKGKLWWLPLARSTPIMYFNKTLFHKAGLPTDRGPKDWDEWYGWTRQLKGIKVKGKQVRMEAYQKIDGDWQFQGSVWQWGGAYSNGLDVTIDQAPAVAAGEWQRKLIFTDKMAYMADSPSVDFQNQLIATLVTSTGGLRGITEAAQKGGWEVGTAFVPGKEKQVVPTGGGGFGILSYAPKDRKEAAWKFVEFVGKPENSAYWTVQTGYLPVIEAAKEQPDLKKLLADNPNFSTAVKQLDIVRKEDEVRLMVPNANILIYTGLQKIWTNNQPAQQVFTDVAGQIRKATDKVRKNIEKHV